eukprot:GHRQ01021901.1.p1 GENE.GHRQ01021901.1~~GHRQ01021901.1.p1  ORF type:complete len:178 (-),score=2.74 GHRQ01021901.1:460-993(-)
MRCSKTVRYCCFATLSLVHDTYGMDPSNMLNRPCQQRATHASAVHFTGHGTSTQNTVNRHSTGTQNTYDPSAVNPSRPAGRPVAPHLLRDNLCTGGCSSISSSNRSSTDAMQSVYVLGSPLPLPGYVVPSGLRLNSHQPSPVKHPAPSSNPAFVTQGTATLQLLAPQLECVIRAACD